MLPWLQGTTNCVTSLQIFVDHAHLSVRVEVGAGLSRDHVNSRPADVLTVGSVYLFVTTVVCNA